MTKYVVRTSRIYDVHSYGTYYKVSNLVKGNWQR